MTQAPVATRPAFEMPKAVQRFLKRPAAVIGLIIIFIVVVLAMLAPVISPYDPFAPSYLEIRKAPSALHWLGTDELGRDILTRVLYGAQVSLSAGFVAVGVALVTGVPLGILSGFFGGWVDMVISRFTDAMLAIPSLILAISFAAFLGPSLSNAMIAIGLSAMPIFIRLTRGQVLSVRTEDYVDGARAIGLPVPWILVRYIFPNIVPPLVVQATITIATAIIAEASLSFLGIGQQPPNPSWGSMLNTAKNFMSQAPWMSLFPGGAICLVVLAFNMLGDGLRDALDPRQN